MNEPPFVIQVKPPSIEYSNEAPVAETVIVPSTTPQLEGSVEAILVMIGATGAVNIISVDVTTQVPSKLRTAIW